MTENRFDDGMEVRRAVLGEEYIARTEANKTGFDADFHRFITETAWGAVWSRPGLDRKTRHMLTIALLAALGQEKELTIHLAATKNTGISAQEVKEILMQVAIYAGIPAAYSAFAIAKSVFEEDGGEIAAQEEAL